MGHSRNTARKFRELQTALNTPSTTNDSDSQHNNNNSRICQAPYSKNPKNNKKNSTCAEIHDNKNNEHQSHQEYPGNIQQTTTGISRSNRKDEQQQTRYPS